MPRHYRRYLDVTPEALQVLYEQHTDSQIGLMYGVTEAAVAGWRKRYGIATMTGRERREQGSSEPSLSALTPALLQDLYSRMGDRQIAKHYGVKKPAIVRLRRLWGIQGISKTERSTSQADLTSEQKEVVIGTMLGDGHLSARGSLSVTHSHLQMDYLAHLYDVLRPLSKTILYLEADGDNGRLYSQFSFSTAQHAWFKTLHCLFYPEGIRVFPISVLNQLTPRSLAYWFMDDGHTADGLPSFALGDIPVESVPEILSSVGQHYGLDVYLRPSSAETSCKVMSMRAVSADKFYRLVTPFILPGMLYKIPRRYWTQGVQPRAPVKVDAVVDLPHSLVAGSKQWAALPVDDQQALVDQWLLFWQGVGFPYPSPREDEVTIIRNLEVEHVLRDGVLKIHQVGQSSCQAFMPHIWATASQGKQSPQEVFFEGGSLRESIQRVLTAGKVPNASQMRGALRWGMGGVYNFRPSAAKVLVDKFCPLGGKVWDPCAGWGGRLFGATLSRANCQYIACEPQPQTYQGLSELAAWMGSYVPGLEDRVQVHNVPAEDFTPPEDLDLVFTSPPYWKREVYGSEDTQSSVRYPTYQAWLCFFWQAVLKKAVGALKPSGWLVLNVDDFDLGGVRYPLVQDTVDLVQSLGLGEPDRLRYSLSSPFRADNHEAILCWCRGPRQAVSSGVVAPLSLCEECGRLTKASALVAGKCPFCQEGKVPLKSCKGCQKPFSPSRSDTLFCSEACNARWRRARKRAETPPSGVRAFKCLACQQPFCTDQPGRFTRCPSCIEKADVDARTKTCQYRHCGESFLDGSTKNTMRFCCVEHRRREKLFRSGVASDLSYFRS